jgi:hypothetical protein
LMRSGERKSAVGWLLKQLMRITPGRMTEWIINRPTGRTTRAANAIRLKDYSSFVKSTETPARRPVAVPGRAVAGPAEVKHRPGLLRGALARARPGRRSPRA